MQFEQENAERTERTQEKTDSFSLTLFGDLQEHNDIAGRIVALAVYMQPDLCIILGDLVGRGRDLDQWEECSKLLEPLQRSCEVVALPGNHDYESRAGVATILAPASVRPECQTICRSGAADAGSFYSIPCSTTVTRSNAEFSGELPPGCLVEGGVGAGKGVGRTRICVRPSSRIHVDRDLPLHFSDDQSGRLRR